MDFVFWLKLGFALSGLYYIYRFLAWLSEGRKWDAGGGAFPGGGDYSDRKSGGVDRGTD